MPRRQVAGFVCVLACLTVAACNNDTPSTPTQPEPVNLTGRWRGDIVYSGAAATFQWTLTQTGNAVTGEVLLQLPSGTVLLNGALTGTLNGVTLPVTIVVAPGGVPNRPTCTGQLTASMNYNRVVPPTLNGILKIASSTCPIPLDNVGLTVAKQ